MPGVYISYPFCQQKCTYCNFASGVLPKSLEEPYLGALAREISETEWQWTPETLYLGGGTPSNIDPAALASLLAGIPGRPWREATMEAAPGTLSGEKAAAWRDAGINRVSLGVQSFVRQEIARTGRKHTAEIVAADVEILRRAGIENFNLDLIAGLAHQTPASWNESLDWLERLAPPHVSVYMFEVDEDSRLGSEILLGGKKYGAMDIPSEDQTARFYETAADRLAAMGIGRYEISNFARSGAESIHNLKYWRMEPYLGFGADAHGFDGGVRRENAEEPQAYIAAVSATGSGCAGTTQSDTSGDKFLTGLRLSQGIRPQPAEWEKYREPIARFVQDGLMESENGNLRLTPRGIMVSNEIMEVFV